MLLSFSISNFRSFNEEQTLSMVATGLSAHPNHLSPIPDSTEKLVSAAVIYGANASGKSNLVRGLGYVKDLIFKGTPPEKNIFRDSFLLEPDAKDLPTTTEIRFVKNQTTFSYGFRISDSQVIEEWLVRLKGDEEDLLFERMTSPDGKVTVNVEHAILSDPESEKVVALSKVGVRANQLFLAGIRESLDTKSYGGIIGGTLEWFKSIRIVFPESETMNLAKKVEEDKDFKNFLSHFLQYCSTGIDRIRAEVVEVDNLSEYPDLVLSAIKTGASVYRGSSGNAIFRSQVGGLSKFLNRRIVAELHRLDGAPVEMLTDQLSDGTQRLINLVPALYHLKTDGVVYIIDEIDRSLHPLLTRKIIEYFLQSDRSPGSQLIVTTHESTLMDLELLRADELWFTEKNASGATTLYPLTDFKIREDLKIDKGYLHGRFGAIPFLGNLDRLQPSHPEA